MSTRIDRGKIYAIAYNDLDQMVIDEYRRCSNIVNVKNLDVSVVEHELVRAILLEMIYRKKPNITAGAVLVEPPDWLIDGVLTLAPGRDRGAPGRRSPTQNGTVEGCRTSGAPPPPVVVSDIQR